MLAQFTEDGNLFAEITTDGKLKIWKTDTSSFKHEFTPNLHLSTPCTCLHWIRGKLQQTQIQSPGNKKRRKSMVDESTPLIALGTSSGTILVYSFLDRKVETTINSNTNLAISCITLDSSDNDTVALYAGAGEYVQRFNVGENSVTSWKTGTDRISSILHVPNKSRLLTASKIIKLWDTQTRENIKTFTGHSSDVALLHFIPSVNADPYFVSGSKNDRLLSCWSLNEKSKEKNAVASLLMEDIALSVSLVEGSNNNTCLAAVTRSGLVHFYQHTLNGKCDKPVKPKVTIQVASDSGESKGLVTPIPIVAAYLKEDTSLIIAHGNNVVLTFEDVVPNTQEKLQCLIRRDPRQIVKSKEKEIMKTKQAVVDNNVDYLTPYTSNNVAFKRKANSVKTEVPMEQRLENLTLNKLDSGVPKQDNVAQLLVQGLHSKDKAILQNVLCKRDETLIKNTVRRLPMPVIVPLLTELTTLVQGKTLASHTGALWLRYLVQSHASQLLSNPELLELLGPVLGTIENRLLLFTPLSRLRGRLDLLVSQITDSSNQQTEPDDALLLFKDLGSSDSESEENFELNLHSDSENEWVEEESTGNDSNVDEEMKIDENNVISDSDCK